MKHPHTHTHTHTQINQAYHGENYMGCIAPYGLGAIGIVEAVIGYIQCIIVLQQQESGQKLNIVKQSLADVDTL